MKKCAECTVAKCLECNNTTVRDLLPLGTTPSTLEDLQQGMILETMKGLLSPVKPPARRKLFTVYFHYLLCNLVPYPAISPFPASSQTYTCIYPPCTHSAPPAGVGRFTLSQCTHYKAHKYPKYFCLAILSINGNIDLSLLCFPGIDTVISFSLKRAGAGLQSVAIIPWHWCQELC